MVCPSPTSSVGVTFALASGFFCSMILTEVVVEGTFVKFAKITGSTLPVAVTLAQFLACFLVPLSVYPGTIRTIPRSLKDIFPYFILSVLVFGATALATASLQYVPYSVKIIFKSTKLIPTMIVSSCMHRISYGSRDYAAAIFLCLGAVGYAYEPGKSSNTTSESTWIGVLILTISAFCDALVPNVQQEMMSKNVPPEELMVNTNIVGLACVTAYILGSGNLLSIVETVKETPELVTYLAVVGCSLAVAVMCYTSLIKRAGSVVAVSIGTMRKILTIALSYVLFPKEFLPIHAISSIFVAAGIILEGMKGYSAKKDEIVISANEKCITPEKA